MTTTPMRPALALFLHLQLLLSAANLTVTTGIGDFLSLLRFRTPHTNIFTATAQQLRLVLLLTRLRRALPRLRSLVLRIEWPLEALQEPWVSLLL